MIWDLPNLLICWIVIVAAYLAGKIQRKHAIFLGLISLVPYCLNDVLFDPKYMPDQFTYLRMLSAIREFTYTPYIYNSRVTEASYLYAILPLPFVETVNSLGFFNKFLMIFIFIWAAAVLKLRNWMLWFLLLYPSLILYSSLGLRDMMICSFMLIVLWSMIRGWYVITVLGLMVLVQIKMQNALIVSLFAAWYMADKHLHFQFTRQQFVSLLSIFLVLGYFIFPYLAPRINYYRYNMYMEDGGIKENYQPITDFFNFLHQALVGIFRTLLYPLPWDANSTLQLMQAAENIVVTFFLCAFSWYSYKRIPKQTITWLFFLLAGMLMYGLIVSNVGTIVRYKLPFIVVYFIFLSYELVRYQSKITAPSMAIKS